MSASESSESEFKEDQVWDDWEAGDDEGELFYPIFASGGACGSWQQCLVRDQTEGFDLLQLVRELSLDFYDTIKLINFARREASLGHTPSEALACLEQGDWKSDVYLKPFMQDDALLFQLPMELEHLAQTQPDRCEEQDISGSLARVL
jgi:hypothetical protein